MAMENETTPDKGKDIASVPGKRDGRNIWRDVIGWVLRILVGGVFIVSGFTKGVDPWGTLYKFDDYLAAMSLGIWPNLVLLGAFALSAVEFVCGVFLLFGCFRRSATVLAALIMAVMLPLTLWIAMSDPVADCGCFGDAFVISNWATFFKNVLLSAGIIWLLRWNRKVHWLVTPALQWIAFVASALFILIIEVIGYSAQPLLDFRPYKEGEMLVDSESSGNSGEDYRFIYEKDGVRKEYGIDDQLPDEADGWQFVERIEVGQDAVPSLPESGKNFRVWSKDGEDDETEDAIISEGKQLIVMMPDLDLVSPATTWKLNSLYEWSGKHDVSMIAVVSGSASEIADWEDLSMASYPIYTADDTQIKSVVRGNPGVVYLKDGVIQWKSTLSAINVDDFLSPETSSDAESFGMDGTLLLKNLVYIYLTVLSVLVFLSFLPELKKMF